jgi:hypothetical protein
MMQKYLVRQYRPAYFSGFLNEVCRSIPYDEITKVPWCENFKHDGFKEFKIKPYGGGELIISAHYDDGKHWVVGFALPEDSNMMAPDGGLLRDNWRYQTHEQL